MNTSASEPKKVFSQRKAVSCILMAFLLIVSSVFPGVIAGADTASAFELVVTNDEAKLYAKNCIGLLAGDITLTYDSDVIDTVAVFNGEDAKQVTSVNFEDNSFTALSNPDNTGKIIYAFYFLDYLWEQEKFSENDLSGECDINSEYFHLATVKFTLKDGKAPEEADFSLFGNARFNSASVNNISFTVINNIVDDEATTEPTPPEATTEEAPSYEEITTEKAPEHPPVTDGPDSLEPQFLLELSGTKARLYIINCVGLYSADMKFSYDPSIISRVQMTTGDAAKQVNPGNYRNNSFTSDYNAFEAGKIYYAFYFKDALWSSEKFREEDLSGKCDINGEYFHLATIDITLCDGVTADKVDFDFSAAISAEFGKDSDFKCVFINYNEPEEPSTEEPSTEEPTTEEPTTEEPTTEEPTTEEPTTEEPTTEEPETEETTVAHKHNFVWEVTKAATSFEEGIETGTCKDCGETITKAVEKLPFIDVKPEAEEEIKISESKDIFVICDTSVDKLLESTPDNTEVVDKDGKPVEKDKPIATGMTVILKDEAGNTVDTKTIVVPGDVNCDGTITATDARSTLRRAVNLESLETYQESAADLESDKGINTKDARLILRASVDLEDINKLFGKLK